MSYQFEKTISSNLGGGVSFASTVEYVGKDKILKKFLLRSEVVRGSIMFVPMDSIFSLTIL